MIITSASPGIIEPYLRPCGAHLPDGDMARLRAARRVALGLLGLLAFVGATAVFSRPPTLESARPAGIAGGTSRIGPAEAHRKAVFDARRERATEARFERTAHQPHE